MAYNFSPYQYQNPYSGYNYGQRTEVVRVNGIEGAKAYQMTPNSNILLLDESAPIVYLKVTDGGGYPTITAYDIAPHIEKKPVDTNDLDERISKLEAVIYGKSDSRSVDGTADTGSTSTSKTDA